MHYNAEMLFETVPFVTISRPHQPGNKAQEEEVDQKFTQGGAGTVVVAVDPHVNCASHRAADAAEDVMLTQRL
jgi:hypothetical protein